MPRNCDQNFIKSLKNRGVKREVERKLSNQQVIALTAVQALLFKAKAHTRLTFPLSRSLSVVALTCLTVFGLCGKVPHTETATDTDVCTILRIRRRCCRWWRRRHFNFAVFFFRTLLRFVCVFIFNCIFNWTATDRADALVFLVQIDKPNKQNLKTILIYIKKN